MLNVYKLLCTALVSFVFALDNVSHQDLENPNGKICGWASSCLSNMSVSSTRHLPDLNCLCDPECAKYGDCCLDSPFFNSAEQRRAPSQYDCIPTENFFPIYRRDNCPPAWKDSRTRKRCEKSTTADAEDPLLITPVTNTYTNTTYGNVYCAACNGDAGHRDHLTYWEQGIRCANDGQPLPPHYDADYVENNMRYNVTINSWEVRTDNRTYNCGLTPLVPSKTKPHLRRCVPTVKTCPAMWSRQDIRDRCETYTLVVTMLVDAASYGSGQTAFRKWYRNVHCAMCNNVPVQALQCALVELDPRFKADIPSFSILFDFTGGSSVGYVQPCAAAQVYDRFFKLCRDVVVRYDDDPENKSDQKTVQPPQNCVKILLQSSEFRRAAGDAIYVAKYSRTFQQWEFRARSGGAVEICSEEFVSSAVPKYRSYLSVLTAFGIGVSIICLCLHLIVFAALKELRNLSGKNLASMCVALLAGYCSFAASARRQPGKWCVVNAVMTYYFFLAAFAWTSMMAFDVWRTLRIATKELRVSAGTQWRKFFVYSLCSWVVPAIIVLMAVLADVWPADVVAESLKPHFGHGHCWFGRGYALALFFGLPLFVILVSNVSFFLSSAYMVYSSHSMAKYSASPNTRKDFKLYARLALIMGLTWIVGVVAGFADAELIWVVFVLLNTTLGLFIFVAFTCRSRILNALKRMRRDNVVTLSVFSWSTACTDDSKISARKTEKKTSTTYY